MFYTLGIAFRLDARFILIIMVGTIEKGGMAATIGVGGDPLKDITVVRKVELVMKEVIIIKEPVNMI